MSNGSHQHNKNCLSVIHLSAKTDAIQGLIKKADAQSLVIWDIDGVLLIGRDKIFHSENIHSGLNQQYVKYIEKKFSLTLGQSEEFLSRLLLQRPIQLVDKALPSIMRKLKSKHIKTIALTQFATGPLGDIKSTADWRIDELDKLGIKFDFAFADLMQVELNKLTKLTNNHPLYKKGVLFCERYPKGEVLGAFLDIISWKPNRIIFIDDKLECLEMVQSELETRSIDFIGVHYTAALDLPYEVDDRVVKFQYDYAMQNGIWLNDQAALDQLEHISRQ